MYLLGSIHMMKKEAYPLNPAIEKAYKDSEGIVFETDLDAVNEVSFQLRMMSSGMYRDGKTLRETLSEKTYLRVTKKIQEYGLELARFDLFKPWFCAMAISMAELKRLGLDPEFGIDNYFFKRAKQENKSLFFLESLDFQLELFSAMDDQNQNLFLEQTLKDVENIEKVFPEIVKYWEFGNLEKLGLAINENFIDYPEIYERFIISRNNKWLSRIDSFIKHNKNILIVVGAAHLVGEKGLIRVLRKKGFKVEQR